MYVKGVFGVFKILQKLGIKPKDIIGVGGDVVKMGKSLFNTKVNPKLIKFIEKNGKIPTKIVEEIKIHARTLKNTSESQKKLFEVNIRDILNAKNAKTLKSPVTGVQRPATSVKEPATEAFKGWIPKVIKGGKDKLATGGIANHFREKVGKPGGVVEPGTEFYAKEVILTEEMKENIKNFEAQEGKGSYNKAEAYTKKRVRDGLWTGTGSGGANIRSTEEILELVKRTKNGDVLIKEWMKNPTKENPVFDKLRETAKKRKTYENQMYTTKKKYDEFRKKRRVWEKKFQESEKYKNYQKKIMATKGIFPAVDSKERVWRDIWRATNQKDGSRFKIISKIPKPVISEKGIKYIPWQNNYKNVVFFDTKTNQKITYDGLEKYMKKYIGKNTYKNAIENYDIKKLLESESIKFKGKDTTVGQILRENILSEKELKANKGFSAIEVNHKGANLDEFWNTEVTTRNANRQLVPLKSRYKTMFDLAKTEKDKAKIIKEFSKEVEKLPGGIRTIFEGTEVGIEPTAKKVITAAAKDKGLLYSKAFRSFVNSLPVKIAGGLIKAGARTVGAAMPVIGPGLVAWGVSDANKAYAAGLTKPDELTVAYNFGPEIAKMWSEYKGKEMKPTLAGEEGLPEIDAFAAKDGGLSGVDNYILNRYK